MPIFGGFIAAVGTIPVLRPVDVEDASKTGASISNMFDRCVDALQEGSAICIFPEGQSHDGTSLVTDRHSKLLKYGIGELAMQARCKEVLVKILPVGIHYSNKTHIRTSVFVAYGEPLEVSAADAAEYKKWAQEHPEGHVRDNSATLKLLPRIQRAIESVWLNAPTPEVRSKAVLAHEVWSDKSANKSNPEIWHNSVQHYVDLQLKHNKAQASAAEAEDACKSEETPGALVVRLLDNYASELDSCGATDQDVAADQINFVCVVMKSFGYFLALIFLLPFLLPGLIVVSPIRVLGHVIATCVAQGIAEGDIKKGVQPEGYKADDVIGTIKILVAMVLVFIFYPAYAAVGCVLLEDTFGIHQAAWFFICLVAVVLIAVISVPFLDGVTYIWQKVTQTCKAGCCCGPTQKHVLKKLRKELSGALVQEKTLPLQAVATDVQSSCPGEVGSVLPL
jgi:hypothetical protein